MKKALLLNAVDPAIGGVLIRGDRGTAKSSAVRALARLLPDYEAVDRCPYRCDPAIPSRYCDDCRRRASAGRLPVVRLPMRIVELPINASEDRLVGSIDIEAAVRAGTRRFQPGVLAEANRNLLYVDEVNLLDDHLVDVLLDAAAMGINVVEREGMSVVHPAHFILVGTMNPEEGELRPQLLDRFGLCVEVTTPTDIEQRLRVMELEREFIDNPQAVQRVFVPEETELRGRLQAATTPTETAQAARGDATQQEGASGGESNEGWTTAEARESPSTEAVDLEPDTVIQLHTFAVKKLDLPRERHARRAAGKRTSTKSETKRGRYVRSSQTEKITDVAFDATVRAAAPHQLRRRQATPDAPNQLQLESQDLRQKVRERKTGNLIVFVVDASASMDAEQRMLATKGAILSLLRHAYVRRDKVALVAFSGRNARVVLRPTSSVDLAERRLERLNIGGTTPLTHGLMTALKLIKTERLRDPRVYPLLVLISDGRGNISLFGEEPLLEAQRTAGQIKQEGIRAMVIDSTRDFSSQPGYPRNRVTSLYGAYAFNVCGDLAERLGGRYYGLFDLSQSAIVDSVQREMLRTGSA